LQRVIKIYFLSVYIKLVFKHQRAVLRAG